MNSKQSYDDYDTRSSMLDKLFEKEQLIPKTIDGICVYPQLDEETNTQTQLPLFNDVNKGGADE